MKKLLLFIALLSLSVVHAQDYSYETYDNYYPTANKVSYTIYSADFKESKKKMESFIKNKNYALINQNETKSFHHYEFKVKQQDIAVLDSFCSTIGYVDSKNLNSYNNENKLLETKVELEWLENKKNEFEKMLNKMDSVKSNKYYEHWEKIRGIDVEIYNAKKIIGQLESISNMYTVSIDLNEEQTNPSGAKINFVQMPGAEFAYLFIENPKPGLSYGSYQGVFLKYLFTKGKSYFSLGALKANNAIKTDSLTYDEIFSFIFGQDWYSRHLGRGSNKFFNLYIGYQAGFSLAYNNLFSKGIPFVSPATGVELFKNKYLLLDCNLNYYLPITNLNRNMRGWRVGCSLNFTF